MNPARAAVLALVLAAACSHGAMAQDPGTLAASEPAGSITLGPGPTEVTLAAAGGGSVAGRLRSVEAGRQIYLTFTRAQAQATPAATYNVYLGLPANATPSGASDPHYVGTLNFFNASSGRPIDMSLNITSRVPRLLAEGDAGDSARVTIIPSGGSPDTPAPQVGDVRITAR